MRRTILAAALAAALTTAASAAPPGAVNQRGDGWPKINGLLLINSHHGSRPLDARPGADPFQGTDPRYRCDGKHANGKCLRKLVRCGEAGGGKRKKRKKLCVSDRLVHNELLGGHGNDTIHGGPWQDVIWGNYKPEGQPPTQFDRLNGHGGRDFIYAAHGWNTIKAGPGNDFVKTHFGRGIVDCGKGRDILYTSRSNLRAKRYKIRRCETVTYRHSPATKHRLKHGPSRS